MNEYPSAFDYVTAFSSNIGVFTEAQQRSLQRLTVGIAGLGGMGGMHALTLARLGVGNFLLSDPDNFELKNFNRQVCASVATLGEYKAETTAEMIWAINPEAKVDYRNEPVSKKDNSVWWICNYSDIIIDALDFFELDTRRALFAEAFDLGKPVISAAPIGLHGMARIFYPGSINLEDRCGFSVHDSKEEALNKFLWRGLCPERKIINDFQPDGVNFSEGRAASTFVGVIEAAAYAARLVLREVLGIN